MEILKGKTMWKKIIFFIFGITLFFCSPCFSFPVNISLDPMQPFSGLSAREILDKRIRAVLSSPVFGDLESYVPSREVYQMEDGADWIGAYEIACYGIDDSKDIGRGASRESAGILNPEFLYYINIPSYGYHKTTGCSETDYLIPYKAEYDAANNRIVVYIDYSSFYRKNKVWHAIVLSDANARDLGYKYAFADIAENIRFRSQDNLSARLTPTVGFYHRGFSCGKQNGCNNYSPYTEGYRFYLTALPAELDIKLWKKRPASADKTPDIRYKIVFK